MQYMGTGEIVANAFARHTIVPGFNIPYLPMMEPVVRALRDTNSFGLIMVARLEWEKFESGSLAAIRQEYEKCKDPRHTRLHLDHVPVIDEDHLRVDYAGIIGQALDLGYESVMVDGSRLPLAENIACTGEIVAAARPYGVPVEAELGSVPGHEAGPLPPYEELFASRFGFTVPEEARCFTAETGCAWLSVSIGNIHGAISAAGKQKEKPHARIDLDHLEKLRLAAGVPLVLHGGTGIPRDYVLAAIRHGIAKVNVATAIRQPYERTLPQGVKAAQEAVYQTMLGIIREDFEIENSADILLSPPTGQERSMERKRGTL